jgi:hypothetical protein
MEAPAKRHLKYSKTVTKAYKRLWNASNELLEEFKMEIMPNIDDATPGELRITEVEEKREASQHRLLSNLQKLIKRS